MGKQLEANEVGIISPDTVQILNFQHGWNGKLDIKNGTLSHNAGKQRVVVLGRLQTSLPKGCMEIPDTKHQRNQNMSREFHPCGSDNLHASHRFTRSRFLMYMRNPLDEHRLPHDGAFTGPCSALNTQRCVVYPSGCMLLALGAMI